MPDIELPTISQLISNWLGVQLPTVAMPQTLKNIDKAIGKIILAGGENVEARIKGNTARVRATNKINVDGLFRTEEEKRKLENRAAATKAALEDMDANPPTADAPSEIDDDWLNYFVRLAEDKSTEQLQQLFGRILSGEIRRPGSFSLRTVHLMSTISKKDAEALSTILSYAINGKILPFEKGENGRPTDEERVFLEELGIAGHPARSGGMVLNVSSLPGQTLLLMASHRWIIIQNDTQQIITVTIPRQTLTTPARELMAIANSPPTDIEFLKNVAEQIHTELRNEHAVAMDIRRLTVHVVTEVVATNPAGEKVVNLNSVYTPEVADGARLPSTGAGAALAPSRSWPAPLRTVGEPY
jgi:hypothetical protein